MTTVTKLTVQQRGEIGRLLSEKIGNWEKIPPQLEFNMTSIYSKVGGGAIAAANMLAPAFVTLMDQAGTPLEALFRATPPEYQDEMQKIWGGKLSVRAPAPVPVSNELPAPASNELYHKFFKDISSTDLFKSTKICPTWKEHPIISYITSLFGDDYLNLIETNLLFSWALFLAYEDCGDKTQCSLLRQEIRGRRSKLSTFFMQCIVHSNTTIRKILGEYENEDYDKAISVPGAYYNFCTRMAKNGGVANQSFDNILNWADEKPLQRICVLIFIRQAREVFPHIFPNCPYTLSADLEKKIQDISPELKEKTRMFSESKSISKMNESKLIAYLTREGFSDFVKPLDGADGALLLSLSGDELDDLKKENNIKFGRWVLFCRWLQKQT